jgi:phospholipid/cholesterol/gamma-HCH transport system ATP-binding protein
VIAVGTIPELLALDHPWIQEYFNGPRGRAAHDSQARKAAAQGSSRARGGAAQGGAGATTDDRTRGMDKPGNGGA